jgi:hypothetical protein
MLDETDGVYISARSVLDAFVTMRLKSHHQSGANKTPRSLAEKVYIQINGFPSNTNAERDTLHV